MIKIILRSNIANTWCVKVFVTKWSTIKLQSVPSIGYRSRKMHLLKIVMDTRNPHSPIINNTRECRIFLPNPSLITLCQSPSLYQFEKLRLTLKLQSLASRLTVKDLNLHLLLPNSLQMTWIFISWIDQLHYQEIKVNSF